MALKPIAGYEGLYLVSEEGDIYSAPKSVNNGRGYYVRPMKKLSYGLRGRDGLKYAFVVLRKNGKESKMSVHRIVANTFLDNPFGLDVVNHKDHNTLNNRVENLEWCGQKYNNEYSHNKRVEQLINGDKIAEYKSVTFASEITGISRTAINNTLAGWSKTAGGYEWKYAKEE